MLNLQQRRAFALPVQHYLVELLLCLEQLLLQLSDLLVLVKILVLQISHLVLIESV